MKYLKYLILIFFFILSSCNHMEDTTTHDLEEIFYFSNMIDLRESDDYLVGQVVLVERYNDSSLVFLDFFRRGIYMLNENTSSIHELGNYGRGPGEYIQPRYLRVTKDGNILFSDISNNNISCIDINGNIIFKIIARRGGLRFDNIGTDVVTLGQPDHAIIHYTIEGKQIGEYGPLSRNDGILIDALEGGGVFIYNNTIYFMKSISTNIYQYDLTNNMLSILNPPSLKEINMNHTVKDNTVYYDGDLITNFEKLILDGELYFVVGIGKMPPHRGYSIIILCKNGEQLIKYDTINILAGTSGDELYFVNTTSNDDEYFNTIITYKHNN